MKVLFAVDGVSTKPPVLSRRDVDKQHGFVLAYKDEEYLFIMVTCPRKYLPLCDEIDDAGYKFYGNGGMSVAKADNLTAWWNQSSLIAGIGKAGLDQSVLLDKIVVDLSKRLAVEA